MWQFLFVRDPKAWCLTVKEFLFASKAFLGQVLEIRTRAGETRERSRWRYGTCRWEMFLFVYIPVGCIAPPTTFGNLLPLLFNGKRSWQYLSEKGKETVMTGTTTEVLQRSVCQTMSFPICYLFGFSAACCSCKDLSTRGSFFLSNHTDTCNYFYFSLPSLGVYIGIAHG